MTSNLGLQTDRKKTIAQRGGVVWLRPSVSGPDFILDSIPGPNYVPLKSIVHGGSDLKGFGTFNDIHTYSRILFP